MTVGPAGRVYVADFYDDRVQVFSQAGQLLGVMGNAGDVLGRLERPTDVVVAEDGSLYIVDFSQDRIVMFQEENMTKERASSLSVLLSLP